MSAGSRLVVGPFNRVEGDPEVHLDIAGGEGALGAGERAPLLGIRADARRRGPARRADDHAADLRHLLDQPVDGCGARARRRDLLVPTPQGAAMAALIHAVENVSDHLVHFTMFFMPDFTRPVCSARPWHRRAVVRFTALEGGAPLDAFCALARQVVDGHPRARALAGGGVLSRVAGRLLELARMQILMEGIARAIDPSARFIMHGRPAAVGQGAGLVEAARGALGHWVRIEASYQIAAPTTRNFSPLDAAGVPGPLEAALFGAPGAEGEATPVAVQHVLRSFDPCMVCTVY